MCKPPSMHSRWPKTLSVSFATQPALLLAVVRPQGQIRPPGARTSLRISLRATFLPISCREAWRKDEVPQHSSFRLSIAYSRGPPAHTAPLHIPATRSSHHPSPPSRHRHPHRHSAPAGPSLDLHTPCLRHFRDGVRQAVLIEVLIVYLQETNRRHFICMSEGACVYRCANSPALSLTKVGRESVPRHRRQRRLGVTVRGPPPARAGRPQRPCISADR